MKTTKTRTFLAFLLGAMVLASTAAYSQEDPLLAETDEVLDSPQIDIDGVYQKKNPIEEARKKLQEQTNQMIDNKIETMRLKNEKKLGSDLQNIFTGKKVDTVSTNQAATQKVEAKVEETKAFDEIKIIPQVGGANIQGENLELNTKVAGSLSIESMVSNRISVGVGVNYMSLTATDIDAYNSNIYYPGGYDIYNTWRMGAYPMGRELEYKNLGVEFNTKFFATVDTRIKPYFGLALGYNRASLKYADQGQMYNYSFNNAQIGDEGVTSTFAQAAALLGAEAKFTKNFGMNLEMRFQRALSEFSQKTQASYMFNPDQEQLNKVAAAIQDANVIAIQAGIVVTF